MKVAAANITRWDHCSGCTPAREAGAIVASRLQQAHCPVLIAGALALGFIARLADCCQCYCYRK